MLKMVADPRAAEALSASVVKASARKPVLPDLRNECVSNHDFWHPPRELQNVVPYPVGSFLVGGKCLIRAIEDADRDQHVWATIEQVLAAKAFHLPQQRDKIIPDAIG